jgi:hypothetical protein
MRIMVHGNIVILNVPESTVEAGIVDPEAKVEMRQAASRKVHRTVGLEEKEAVLRTRSLHVYDAIGLSEYLHVEQVGVEPE